MFSDFWPESEILSGVIKEVDQPGEPPRQFRMIYMSEMDFLTYELERQGMKVWFTCEANGTEYRLASPRE